MDTEVKHENTHTLLAQNTTNEEVNIDSEISNSEVMSSLAEQDGIDSSILDSKHDETFKQCSSIGNIYSEEELAENLQTLDG
ncbi:hypothetical protein J6T66_05015 [bacterium]|nr:hypothetical protein [bacterium]